MNRLLSSVLLLAPMVAGAQEIITLDQSLAVQYNASHVSFGGVASGNFMSRTDYQFDLGLPIWSYRLGALNLGGGLGWIKQGGDIGNDSALALNTLGLRGSLFPYQPYHVSFDYSHSSSPNLFGEGRNNGDIWGLGLTYRGRQVQNLRVAYRHGAVSGASRGQYSSLSVTEDQRRGRTDLRIGADWQEARYGSGDPWRSTMLSIFTHTPLAGNWAFNNSMMSFAYQGSSQIQAGSTLQGTAGTWTTLTTLDAGYVETQGRTDRTLGLSQSLARTWGRLSGFSQAGFSAVSSSAPSGGAAPMGNLTLGASYKLSQTWSLSGDVSGAWTGANDLVTGVPSVGMTRTLHVGLTWGASLSDQLKHAMFYWSNLRFQRHVQENYPPGYLPQELLQAQMNRRLAQEGGLNFSSDAYQVANNLGHQRWFRIQGGLHINSGLMIQTIGDLRKDEGLASRGYIREDRHLNLYGAQTLGRGSLSFGLGYSLSKLSATGEAPSGQTYLPWLDSNSRRPSTYYSVGTNTFLGYVPLGCILTRNNDSMGLGTTSLMTYTTAGYGKFQFRLTYQQGWRSDGLRTNQITINLLRWFDTMALWGLGN